MAHCFSPSAPWPVRPGVWSTNYYNWYFKKYLLVFLIAICRLLVIFANQLRHTKQLWLRFSFYMYIYINIIIVIITFYSVRLSVQSQWPRRTIRGKTWVHASGCMALNTRSMHPTTLTNAAGVATYCKTVYQFFCSLGRSFGHFPFTC